MGTFSELDDEFPENRIESDMDYKELLHRYVRHWRWFLASVIITLSIGYIYAKRQVPEYNVNIKLLIKDKEKSGDKDLLEQLNLFSSDKIIDNEIQILKTNLLMEKVVQSLELQNTYIIEKKLSKQFLYKDYLPFKIDVVKPSNNIGRQKWIAQVINSNAIELNGKRVPFNHPTETDAGLIIVVPQRLENFRNIPINVIFGTVSGVAQNYINKLAIVPASKQSTVLFISMEDEIPERGKDILTKLVDEYNQISIEDKNKTTANTLAFIESRIASVSSELNGVEKSVETYKSKNGIVDISAQSAIFLSNLQNNDAQIMKIDLEFGILKNLEDYVSNANADQSKLPAMQGIDDPSLLSLVAQLGETQLKKESLLRTIPQTNPVVNSINDQIKALKKTILQTLQNVRSGLAQSKKQLSNQNRKYESIIKDVPSKERGLIDVMRNREIKNALFTFLLQKREEAAMSMASTVSDSKTIDKAQSSGMYFKPAKNVIYIAFLAMGLLIPIFIIYIKNALNSTIKRQSDIKKITLVPILGQISYSAEPNPMVAIEQPRSMIAEQIRGVRTNLSFIMPVVKSKVILFTSSISGEGKSFISLNLGASLASTGKKVIVIELDLRKPKFQVTLGLNNELGISSYLIGAVKAQDVINEIPNQENFFVITSGIIPPNPAELLLNGRIEELINELKKEFDYIIMDAPPIGLLTDAQILSQYADSTLFIVRYNYTMKESISMVEEFRRKKLFKNLNIVFNSVDDSQRGYGYGYGYGYYEQNPPKKSWLNIFSKK